MLDSAHFVTYRAVEVDLSSGFESVCQCFFRTPRAQSESQKRAIQWLHEWINAVPVILLASWRKRGIMKKIPAHTLIDSIALCTVLTGNTAREIRYQRGVISCRM